jgi:hypothetical protein
MNSTGLHFIERTIGITADFIKCGIGQLKWVRQETQGMKQAQRVKEEGQGMSNPKKAKLPEKNIEKLKRKEGDTIKHIK